MNYAIEAKDLTKQYGDQVVLDKVNLHVRPGEIYGLLGRNGAGKTTIMKMLLGLSSVTSGDAFLLGKSLKNCDREVYSKIGNIIEIPGFYPELSGYENLQVFAKLKVNVSKNEIKDAMELVELPIHDKKPFSNYSLGMKQRLGIANALMNNPELLILDEPSNGLDPIGIAEMRELLKVLSAGGGKTIFISSHQLSEVGQLADTIGILHKGVLLEENDMEGISGENLEDHFRNITGGVGIG